MKKDNTLKMRKGISEPVNPNMNTRYSGCVSSGFHYVCLESNAGCSGSGEGISLIKVVGGLAILDWLSR